MLSLKGEVYTEIIWRYFYFLFVTDSQFHYIFSTLFYHLYKCYQFNYYRFNVKCYPNSLWRSL